MGGVGDYSVKSFVILKLMHALRMHKLNHSQTLTRVRNAKCATPCTPCTVVMIFTTRGVRIGSDRISLLLLTKEC